MTDRYHNPDVEAALAAFRSHVQNKDDEAARRKAADDEIIERKSEQLMELRMLLSHLQNMGVMVTNTRVNNRTELSAPAQPLVVRESPSSESWAPGRSLMLDHPAVMEIAIPNTHQKNKNGAVVVIHLASAHPEAGLFAQPFHNMGDAIKALAQFIALSTVSVQRLNLDAPRSEDEEGQAQEGQDNKQTATAVRL